MLSFLFLYSFLFFSYQCRCISIYVDGKSGNDEKNNGTIRFPFKTIQKAVDTSSPDTTIYVKKGDYPVVNPISIYQNINLTIRPFDDNALAFETVVHPKGELSSFLLFIANSSLTTIERITFSGGNDPFVCGGMLIRDSESTLIDGCVISNSWSLKGGGGYLWNARMTIFRDCEFRNNYVLMENKKVESVLVKADQFSYHESLFMGNFPTYLQTDYETGFGGGLYIDSSDILFDNCIISNNSAMFGGAMLISGKSNVDLVGSRLIANRATLQGSALFVLDLNSEFVLNNTDVMENHCSDFRCQVIYSNVVKKGWFNLGGSLPVLDPFLLWMGSISGIVLVVNGFLQCLYYSVTVILSRRRKKLLFSVKSADEFLMSSSSSSSEEEEEEIQQQLLLLQEEEEEEEEEEDVIKTTTFVDFDEGETGVVDGINVDVVKIEEEEEIVDGGKDGGRRKRSYSSSTSTTTTTTSEDGSRKKKKKKRKKKNFDDDVSSNEDGNDVEEEEKEEEEVEEEEEEESLLRLLCGGCCCRSCNFFSGEERRRRKEIKNMNRRRRMISKKKAKKKRKKLKTRKKLVSQLLTIRLFEEENQLSYYCLQIIYLWFGFSNSLFLWRIVHVFLIMVFFLSVLLYELIDESKTTKLEYDTFDKIRNFIKLSNRFISYFTPFAMYISLLIFYSFMRKEWRLFNCYNLFFAITLLGSGLMISILLSIIFYDNDLEIVEVVIWLLYGQVLSIFIFSCSTISDYMILLMRQYFIKVRDTFHKPYFRGEKAIYDFVRLKAILKRVNESTWIIVLPLIVIVLVEWVSVVVSSIIGIRIEATDNENVFERYSYFLVYGIVCIFSLIFFSRVTMSSEIWMKRVEGFLLNSRYVEDDMDEELMKMMRKDDERFNSVMLFTNAKEMRRTLMNPDLPVVNRKIVSELIKFSNYVRTTFFIFRFPFTIDLTFSNLTRWITIIFGCITATSVFSRNFSQLLFIDQS